MAPGAIYGAVLGPNFDVSFFVMDRATFRSLLFTVAVAMLDPVQAVVTLCAIFNCDEVALMRGFALRNLAISLCRSVLLCLPRP